MQKNRMCQNRKAFVECSSFRIRSNWHIRNLTAHHFMRTQHTHNTLVYKWDFDSHFDSSYMWKTNANQLQSIWNKPVNISSVAYTIWLDYFEFLIEGKKLNKFHVNCFDMYDRPFLSSLCWKFKFIHILSAVLIHEKSEWDDF